MVLWKSSIILLMRNKQRASEQINPSRFNKRDKVKMESVNTNRSLIVMYM